MSTEILAAIPWDTIILAIAGGITYAWSQYKGSGAIAKEGWKWEIITTIIDSVIQMTYDKFIKKYKKDGVKITPSARAVAMRFAVDEVRKRCAKYGIDHEILENTESTTAELRDLIESRIAAAKAGRK